MFEHDEKSLKPDVLGGLLASPQFFPGSVLLGIRDWLCSEPTQMHF